jgi:cytochrome c oxidase subunit IV
MTRDPHEHVVSHQDPLHHVTPPKTYYVIFGALLVLTLITVLIAFVDLGIFNTPVALGIAGAKAMLVLLYFMHVRYATRVTWLVVGGSLMWVGVLMVLTFADYVSRGWSLS